MENNGYIFEQLEESESQINKILTCYDRLECGA